jgi:ribosomal protein S18 acetylase RimI-like enzyme
MQSMISTRRATREDLEGIAELFDTYRQFYKQAPDLALARRFIGERMERDESVIFVAEGDAKKLIGFCQLYPTFCSVRAAPIFVLYDLFVAPSARRTGAGRALMLAAEEYAREAGVGRMDLSTATDNIPGQTLYESLGWVRDTDYYVYNRTIT